MLQVEPAKPLIVWPFGINQHHFVVEISQCSKIETYLYSHHFWVKLNYRKQMAPLLLFPKTEPNPTSKNLSNTLQKSQRVELIPFRILYWKGECWQSLSWRVDFYHTVSNFQIQINKYISCMNKSTEVSFWKFFSSIIWHSESRKALNSGLVPYLILVS